MNDGKLLLIRQNAKILSLLMKNDRLLSAKVYKEDAASLIGNIYIGKVINVSGSTNAAFVEIAPGTSGFLPLAEAKHPHMVNRSAGGSLHPGDELVVQVVRDAVRSKQPVLTAKISLAGTYIAATDDTRVLGISTKLSAEKRKEISAFLKDNSLIDEKHNCNSQTGMVVRTNAASLNDFTPLIAEWHQLSEQLHTILEAAVHRTCFTCLRQNGKPYLTDLKNYYTDDFNEIITDCEDIYQDLTAYYESCRKEGLPIYAVRYYQDEYPLEKLYQVKTRLDGALSSRVWLKSGGYLVIEPTEALTVIDVNSGKCEGKNGEDTLFKINLEAAEEIALQLRLRNLSGMIIIDFISMTEEEKQQELLRKLRSCVRKDVTKTTVVDITPLGLVEVTRKRTARPLKELL